MKLRCHKHGGTCAYFTDGRIYDARLTGSGRVAEVTDDAGHLRVISLEPGAHCAHVIMPTREGFHVPVGTWECVDEEPADCVRFHVAGYGKCIHCGWTPPR